MARAHARVTSSGAARGGFRMGSGRAASSRSLQQVRPSCEPGKIKVKDDELDATFKEASGPIDFTVFLNVLGSS